MSHNRTARVRSPDERRCEGARENDDRGAGGGRKQPPERARPPRAQEAAPGPRRLHALPVPSAVRSCFLTTKKRQARLLRHDLLWGHRGPHRSWFRSSWITPHAARRLLQESQNQNNCVTSNPLCSKTVSPSFLTLRTQTPLCSYQRVY